MSSDFGDLEVTHRNVPLSILICGTTSSSHHLGLSKTTFVVFSSFLGFKNTKSTSNYLRGHYFLLEVFLQFRIGIFTEAYILLDVATPH
jgi:hypothetical protein